MQQFIDSCSIFIKYIVRSAAHCNTPAFQNIDKVSSPMTVRRKRRLKPHLTVLGGYEFIYLRICQHNKRCHCAITVDADNTVTRLICRRPCVILQPLRLIAGNSIIGPIGTARLCPRATHRRCQLSAAHNAYAPRHHPTDTHSR